MRKAAEDAGGGGRRRGAPRSDRGHPKRDLGPAARTESSFDWAMPLQAWRAADEFTMEAIEIASVQAEEAVVPFLASRTERRFRGASVVELRFADARTLASFRRTRAVTAVPGRDVWRLKRKWARAGGDGGLDEAMCGAVARFLNEDFTVLLRAEVLTLIIEGN